MSMIDAILRGSIAGRWCTQVSACARACVVVARCRASKLLIASRESSKCDVNSRFSNLVTNNRNDRIKERRMI